MQKTTVGAGAASEGGAPPSNFLVDAPANSTSSKPTKTKAKGTTGKKGKGAAPPEETHRCFHCQSEGAKMMCCSQCHRAQVVLWQAVPEEALEAAQEGLQHKGPSRE